MTTDTELIPNPQPEARTRLPSWAILLGVGVIFVGALMALLLIRPPQKSLCDAPRRT